MYTLSDLFLFFKVRQFLRREAREVRRRFPTFAAYDRALKRAYRFRNPYTICKRHLLERGEREVDAYGETPLPVYAEIVKQCALTEKDVVLELGCGRGRGVFFLSHLTGCQAVGVDWNPFFIRAAEHIAARFPQDRVSFCPQEMLEADFSRATVIYLYGTCLSDEHISRLARRLEALSSAVQIVTVSYPLSSYSPRFRRLRQFTALFPWGEAEIFIEALSSQPVEEQTSGTGLCN